MINETILIAGHGGQGILFAGTVLAQAALAAGLEATFFPSYGAEIRGGTANCAVRISQRPIGALFAEQWTGALFLNAPSFERFSSGARPDAVCVVNESLVSHAAFTQSVRLVSLPLTELSQQRCGSPKYANVIGLGALIATGGFLDVRYLKGAITAAFAHKPDIAHHNELALETGYSYGTEPAYSHR